MSDGYLELVRRLTDLERRIARLETIEKPAVAMPWNSANSLMPYSANATIGYFLRLSGYTYFHRFRCLTDVAGTNNGSNYWTITLKETGTGATIASFTTSADTGNVDTLHDISSLTQPTSTRSMYQIDITKTGTPANLYITPGLYAMFQT